MKWYPTNDLYRQTTMHPTLQNSKRLWQLTVIKTHHGMGDGMVHFNFKLIWHTRLKLKAPTHVQCVNWTKKKVFNFNNNKPIHNITNNHWLPIFWYLKVFLYIVLFSALFICYWPKHESYTLLIDFGQNYGNKQPVNSTQLLLVCPTQEIVISVSKDMRLSKWQICQFIG